jgi:hypothetical protein
MYHTDFNDHFARNSQVWCVENLLKTVTERISCSCSEERTEPPLPPYIYEVWCLIKHKGNFSEA